MKISIVTMLLVGLVFAGCWVEENRLPDEFKQAIPEAGIVNLAIPGAGEDGTLRQALEAAKADGDVKAKFYLDTINGVRGLNGMTWALLHFVDDITENPYTNEVENGYEWGPFTPALSLVTIKFTLLKEGANHFSYSLQFRKKEDVEGPFEDVLTGAYESSGGALKSVGTMVLDFDQAKVLDETMKASGVITFDYDTTGDGRAIDVNLEAFQDEDMEEAADATYSYLENADLSGEYGFSMVADVHQDDPDRQDLTLKENLSYHIRWVAEGNGRADVLVTGGDFPNIDPPVDSFHMSECWDEFFNQIYLQQTVVQTGLEPWSGEPVGDVAGCVFADADFR
jgi:hypothetical protein